MTTADAVMQRARAVGYCRVTAQQLARQARAAAGSPSAVALRVVRPASQSATR